jgi:DNA-directed RNA polymerase specialized sigma24 family protein
MTRDEILAHLRERILAFAASRMGRDIAEDLAQEVLIVIEQKYSEVSELSDLLPLSLQITRFKMAGVRRKSSGGESGLIHRHARGAGPQEGIGGALDGGCAETRRTLPGTDSSETIRKEFRGNSEGTRRRVN